MNILVKIIFGLLALGCGFVSVVMLMVSPMLAMAFDNPNAGNEPIWWIAKFFGIWLLFVFLTFFFGSQCNK